MKSIVIVGLLFIIQGMLALLPAQNNENGCISLEGNQLKLSDVLKEIEKQADCTFIFSYEDVAPYRKDVAFHQTPLPEALEILFRNLPLKYIYKSGCYVITKEKDDPNQARLEGSAYGVRQQEGICGRIVDKEQRPVEAALIWLVHAETNRSLAQAITDEEGYFHLSCVDNSVKLTVTCLGFDSYVSEPFDASLPHHLSPIVLSDRSLVLDDVVILGEKSKPIIEQKAGKLVFYVENSINAQGSNAFEILRQTPGVTIDEGTKAISINGRSGVLVMLNGKQTYMQQSEVVDLLKSTASSNISSIEVMSNATAQYDAAGSGGILNIVLKKNRQEGYNMTINMGMGYWFHLKQNTELSFNYNKNRVNLYGNYSHDFGHVGLFYGSTRKQSGFLFESRSDDVDKRNTAAATLGLDYMIDPHQTIGIQGNGNFLFGPGTIWTGTDIYDSYEHGQLLYSIDSRSDYEHQVANRYNFNVNYRYEVPEVRLFTFDLDYGLFRGDSKMYQPNAYYSVAHVLDSMQTYRSFGDRDIHLYALSSGYQQKLGPGELMGGAKFSNVSSQNAYKLFDVKEDRELIDKELSNDFHYVESILAGYLLYDFSFAERWSANLGGRIEYTHTNGLLIPLSGNESPENHVKRDYVDFFPSIGINYKPDSKQTLSLSYGKRIDRPVYSDLNPIEQPLDGLSSWKGNPFLIPQKTHRISLQYQYDRTSVELSYSKTNDYRVQITDTLGVDKVVMIPQNLGTQTYYGMALTQALRFFHAWDLNFSGRIYHLDNRMAFDATRFYHRKRWAGGFSLQTSFPLLWGIRAELLGTYASKRLGGSTEVMSPNGFINVGLQKKFLNDKAAVKLSLSDIFWTNNWDNVNRFDGFESVSYGYGETRMVRINFTYTFGGSTQSHSKQSNVDAELNRF